MQKKIELSREQVIFLSFLGILGNLVYSHTWMDDLTDRSAWVAAFLGVLLVIPFGVWLFFLGKYYPQGTVFDMLEKGLGKLITKFLGLLFIVINIAVAVAQLNMFTELLKVFFLQFTPTWVIMLFLAAVCFLIANGGIMGFARLAEFLGILGVINFVVAFVFAFPNFIHVEYFIPVFDTTWTGFFKGSLYITGSAAEGLLLLMIIIKYIPDPRKHYMWVVHGIAISAVVIAFAIFIIIAIMSPELAKRIAFGGVNAASLIKIGDFLQGLEIFIFGSYQFVAIGKVTAGIYCSWMVMKKIFTEKKPMLQLIIVTLLILIPSLWINSYNKAYFLSVTLGSSILLPFCVTVLILATISIFIINKRTGRFSK